jgi:hypothetical protein
MVRSGEMPMVTFSFFLFYLLYLLLTSYLGTNWKSGTATANMRRTHDGDDDRRMGGETGDEEMRRTTRKRPKRCGRLLGYRMFFLFIYFLLTHF